MNTGVFGCQEIVIGEKGSVRYPVCSPEGVLFLKLMNVSPDLFVGEKSYVGFRAVGTTKLLEFTIRTDGSIVQYADASYQRFNACATTAVSPTEVAVSTTGTSCNVGSFIDTAVAEGTGVHEIYYNGVLLCCQANQGAEGQPKVLIDGPSTCYLSSDIKTVGIGCQALYMQD